MDYDDDYVNNTEGYGYDHRYGWNGDNYGRDYYGGNDYGNYHGDYRRGGGYQPGYGPRRYGHGGPGPVPPEAWRDEFGPERPQFHPRNETPSAFLLRCGVPRHLVVGLPKEILDLMRNDSCGVCGQEFNLKMCRLHYISKNHLKLQKKWLAQQGQVGSRRPKEIPFKSRDLYCELCDVHITSKLHADSHYSGKAHRAIVLGRKRPKNPFLLQTSMKDRLDQLIRREKKSIKFADETEEKVVQPFQPELYCDICKTSVTCSDQMTMHLNGKRHQAKEKNYILSMMQVGKPVIEEPANENKETAVKAKAESTQDDNKKENDDGWGAGSGTWDDDPQ